MNLKSLLCLILVPIFLPTAVVHANFGWHFTDPGLTTIAGDACPSSTVAAVTASKGAVAGPFFTEEECSSVRTLAFQACKTLASIVNLIRIVVDEKTLTCTMNCVPGLQCTGSDIVRPGDPQTGAGGASGISGECGGSEGGFELCQNLGGSSSSASISYPALAIEAQKQFWDEFEGKLKGHEKKVGRMTRVYLFSKFKRLMAENPEIWKKLLADPDFRRLMQNPNKNDDDFLNALSNILYRHSREERGLKKKKRLFGRILAGIKNKLSIKKLIDKETFEESRKKWFAKRLLEGLKEGFERMPKNATIAVTAQGAFLIWKGVRIAIDLNSYSKSIHGFMDDMAKISAMHNGGEITYDEFQTLMNAKEKEIIQFETDFKSNLFEVVKNRVGMGRYKKDQKARTGSVRKIGGGKPGKVRGIGRGGRGPPLRAGGWSLEYEGPTSTAGESRLFSGGESAGHVEAAPQFISTPPPPAHGSEKSDLGYFKEGAAAIVKRNFKDLFTPNKYKTKKELDSAREKFTKWVEDALLSGWTESELNKAIVIGAFKMKTGFNYDNMLQTSIGVVGKETVDNYFKGLTRLSKLRALPQSPANRKLINEALESLAKNKTGFIKLVEKSPSLKKFLLGRTWGFLSGAAAGGLLVVLDPENVRLVFEQLAEVHIAALNAGAKESPPIDAPMYDPDNPAESFDETLYDPEKVEQYKKLMDDLKTSRRETQAREMKKFGIQR